MKSHRVEHSPRQSNEWVTLTYLAGAKLNQGSSNIPIGQNSHDIESGSTTTKSVHQNKNKNSTKSVHQNKNKNSKTSRNAKISISDDLTKRRAYLAWQARQLKFGRLINDTWTYDSKILIKDKYGRITQVNIQQDISKFK